jgi:hypothetical protein
LLIDGEPQTEAMRKGSAHIRKDIVGAHIVWFQLARDGVREFLRPGDLLAAALHLDPAFAGLR